MHKKEFISVTGFYGTGSSALIDILKEYSDVCIASPHGGEYEHVALFYPGCLIDLYTILSSDSCSPYNADSAITNFIKSSSFLNNDFGWFGSYRKYYGKKYDLINRSFVDGICRYTGRKSAAHIKSVRFSLLKASLEVAAKLFVKRPILNFGRVYSYDRHGGFAFTKDPEDLSLICKKYTSDYLEMCSSDNVPINVFDHLIWPQQSFLIEKLFNDNFKMIIVTRDPRDVFLLNKYYWHKPPVSFSKPYYSTDPKEFCNEWKNTVRFFSESKKVLIIRFEDLIYHHEDTVLSIEQFIGSNRKSIKPSPFSFDVEESIENTQIFNCSNSWKEEVEIIETELKDYLYKFPYSRTPNKDKWFDTNSQRKK